MVIKLLLFIPDLIDPILVRRFTTMLETPEVDHSEDWKAGMAIALIIVIKRFITSAINTHMRLTMMNMGNKAVDSLKFILFKKQFKISPSSNIQMTNSKLMSIIEHEPHVIWRFIWEISDLIFVPLDFAYSLLMLCYAMGFSTVTGLVMYFVVYCVNWQRNQFYRVTEEPCRKISEKKD